MNEQISEASQTISIVLDEIVALITVFGMDVLGALVLLVVGIWAAGWASRGVRASLGKTKRIDETLTGFFASLTRYGVLAVVIIAVLNQFGVETTSLIAVLGAAGLAIGLALQGTLSNVAAGVMLLIFRPFKVGDFVEAGGHAGTVKELNLFFCVMATPDNVRISVPNSAIWGGSIVNYSANPVRRLDFVFSVSYDADLDKAIKTIADILSNDERTHADPEPLVVVSELAASSVDITARIWVDASDYWALKWDMTKAVKEGLDVKGIDIPFPTQLLITKDSQNHP